MLNGQIRLKVAAGRCTGRKAPSLVTRSLGSGVPPIRWLLKKPEAVRPEDKVHAGEWRWSALQVMLAREASGFGIPAPAGGRAVETTELLPQSAAELVVKEAVLEVQHCTLRGIHDTRPGDEQRGACRGILTWSLVDGTLHRFRAHRTIMATGGLRLGALLLTAAHRDTGDGTAWRLTALG
jgi:hypothetical protein